MVFTVKKHHCIAIINTDINAKNQNNTIIVTKNVI